MNKKQIIQIVIIVAAFAGAGLVLYNGLFSNPNNAALLQGQTLSGNQGKPEEVLPNGTALDFSVLDKKRFQYNQTTYPKLYSNGDYGIPPSNLFVQPPAN